MERIGEARNMLENKAISEKRTVNENSLSGPPIIYRWGGVHHFVRTRVGKYDIMCGMEKNGPIRYGVADYAELWKANAKQTNHL